MHIGVAVVRRGVLHSPFFNGWRVLLVVFYFALDGQHNAFDALGLGIHQVIDIFGLELIVQFGQDLFWVSPLYC